MVFLVLKALHIIFVVTWFAALFYIVRLFIYAAEAAELENALQKQILHEQYSLMQRRLWLGIGWPSAILTAALGAGLLQTYSTFPRWLWLKLAIVGFLYVYHLSCQHIFGQQQRGDFRYTSFQLRVWNEVATVILFTAVFVVVLKDQLDVLFVLWGLILLSLLLFVAVKIYAKIRGAH